MFQKGENIQWASQAGGVMKVKMGEVVAIVAPGQLPATLGFKRTRTLEGFKARNVVSYIVKVGNKFYWPRVKGLTLVTPAHAMASLTE